MVFWMVAEPLRMLAGYYGNLQENVSCWHIVGACSAMHQHAYHTSTGSATHAGIVDDHCTCIRMHITKS